MPRRKASAVEVSNTGNAPVSLTLVPDKLSPRDRLVVDMLLEIVSVRGAVKDDIVKNIVAVANEVAKELDW